MVGPTPVAARRLRLSAGAPRGANEVPRRRSLLVLSLGILMAVTSLLGLPASAASGPGTTSCTSGWQVIAEYGDSFTWTEAFPGIRAVSWTGAVRLLENLDMSCYVHGIQIVYTGPVSGGTLAITATPFVSYTIQYPDAFTDYGNVGANAYGDLVSWTPAAGTYTGYRVETHFDINPRGADEYFVQGLGLGGVVSGVTVKIGLPLSLLGETVNAQIHVGRNLCKCSVTGVFLSGSAPPPPFDFSLSVNPTSGTVVRGGSVSASLTATLVSGTSTAVTFSASGLPSGATASFAPPQCLPTCSSTMTISTSGSTPTGTYPITISATGGGVTRTAAYTLVVQDPFDFSLSVNPTSGTVTAGDSATASVTASLVSGTPTGVTFDATGLPPGGTFAFAPVQCVPTCTSTMTLGSSTSTPSGTYSISITATGGGVSNTTMYTLVVQSPPPPFDFSLSVSPASGTVTPGGSAQTNASATWVSGTSVAVTFNASGLPSGATAAFAPSQCVPTCMSTVTLSTSTSTPNGTFSITVSASGGGVTRTATYTLIVQGPLQIWDVFIHAHEDDWQLFESPYSYYDYNAGHQLLFIYGTAGDGGQPDTYWHARETASETSVQTLVGGNGAGTSGFVSICYTDVTSVCHNVWQWMYDRTVSTYMRLPDGNVDGLGFASTGFQTIEKLREGSISGITTVDSSATYRSWRDLYLTIAAVINASAPYDSSTQIYAPDFDRTRQAYEGKSCSGCSDHADHLAIGDAVANITIGMGTPWTRSFVIDYPIGWADSRYPVNLSSAEYNIKKALFMAYSDAMKAMVGEDAYGGNVNFWECIFQREYSRTI